MGAWAKRQTGDVLKGPLKSWSSAPEMVKEVSAAVKSGMAAGGGDAPRVVIIGALGRGARWTAESCGAKVTGWDIEETTAAEKEGGSLYNEILDHDVFVNCILLQKSRPIPYSS